jgi:hypothetical protein
MTPAESYFRELRDIRSCGAAVKETSYYPALSNLLNEVGKGLKPRVRCIIQLANRGAGLPDGGLFTAEQFQKPGSGLNLRCQCIAATPVFRPGQARSTQALQVPYRQLQFSDVLLSSRES